LAAGRAKNVSGYHLGQLWGTVPAKRQEVFNVVKAARRRLAAVQAWRARARRESEAPAELGLATRRGPLMIIDAATSGIAPATV
jgi:hypothetical protein